MEINENTTLEELNEDPALSLMKDQWIFGWEEEFRGEKGKRTLSDLQREHPAWNASDMRKGIENVQRVLKEEISFVFPLSEKSSLIYLPSEKRKHSCWFLLCAGGAYGAVCTLVESLPVAARLNEMGFDCFCLNYHIATRESFFNGLMPKPLEDIAEAMRLIREKESSFHLKIQDCFLGGFSAGGHLAACYALNDVGASSYSLPRPKGLLLFYPLVSLEREEEKTAQFMRTGLFGICDAKKKADAYEIPKRMDRDYPPVYLVYCLDDETLSHRQPEVMKEALEKNDIPHLFRAYEKGGHGFGLGSILPGDHIGEAVSFLMKGVSYERKDQ